MDYPGGPRMPSQASLERAEGELTRTPRREGDVKMETETWGMQPRAKERWQPPGEMDSPLGLPERAQLPANTLI